MINCLYNEKRICSFDLKNKYGHYLFDKVKIIKKAGENRLLKCEECGEPVILKAGDIKIPHFAHLSSSNCHYSNYSKESEEHKQGKLILYHYFKEKYPNAEVMIDYRLSNGRRANVLVIFKDGRQLAVEYQRKDIKVKDWQLRHQDYQKLKINDLWILSTKQYNPLETIKNKKYLFFNDLLIHDTKDNIAAFLNTDNYKMTLIKKMDYRNKDGIISNQKYFWQEYSLEEINILEDGSLDCNFHLKYIAEKKRFLEQCRKSEEVIEKKRLDINKRARNKIRHHHKETYYNTIRKSKKELENEAEVLLKENPNGPWFDSENNRWGFCRICGLFTSDWTSFNGVENSCICRDCRHNE
ncbi:MAG: competence protein CoiA [Halanaerobiales bacterium]